MSTTEPHPEQLLGAATPLSYEAGMRSFTDEVAAAAERIADIVPETPLERSDSLSNEVGCEVLLKRDDLTQVHSFKVRGAANKIRMLDSLEQAHGVIAASAGNHAQGVAFTARQLDMPATIVMPTTTPEQKVTAVQELGAEVVLHGDTYSDAYGYSCELQAETGATYIHPFDDPDVIAGQATVALEILAQRPDVTHIFVPVGGGGLLAGVTQLIKTTHPDVTVIGVEPVGSSMMTQSLDANELLEAQYVGGFADGVAVKKVGEHTFEAAKLADGMVTVDDDDLCVCLANFVLETRSTLETAGALGIAGLKEYAQTTGLPVDAVAVAICSGANIDNSRLLHVLSRSEQASDRTALLRIALPERPGALRELCEAAVNGHNITHFGYRKNSSKPDAHITIGLRVRGVADKDLLFQTLATHDYAYTDLSDNQLIKEHGVRPSGDEPMPAQESFYALEFADRPGALLQLLQNLGDQWNISMFHYGGSEGDVGRVVVGFETTDRESLEAIFKAHAKSYRAADDDVTLMYT